MDVNLDFIKTEPEDEGVKIETLDVQIKEELTPIQTELLSCVKTEINELPPTESSPKISTESTPLLCKQEPLDTFSDAGHHFMSSLIDQTNNETKPGCSFDIKPPDDGFDVPGPGQCYAAPLLTVMHKRPIMFLLANEGRTTSNHDQSVLITKYDPTKGNTLTHHELAIKESQQLENEVIKKSKREKLEEVTKDHNTINEDEDNSYFSEEKMSGSEYSPSDEDQYEQREINKGKNKEKKNDLIDLKKPSCDTTVKSETELDHISTNNNTNSVLQISCAKKSQVGNRIRDKRHACYFCHKLILHMARHFEATHLDETNIARALSYEKKSSKRREIFQEIIRAGDFLHNCNVISKKHGELILVRRPTKQEIMFNSYKDYGPCPHCLGFLLKKHLWQHVKYCSKQINNNLSNEPLNTNRQIIAESNAILSNVFGLEFSSEYRHFIMNSLRDDDIGNFCRDDNVLLKFGAMQFEKYGTTHCEIIRQSMRQLARLMLIVRKLTSQDIYLSDLLTPQKFDLIVQGVQKLCQHIVDDATKRPKLMIPSLAIKLGHSLKKCASIERGVALRQENFRRNESLLSFCNLMELEWQLRLSSNAGQLLPLTDDLLKCNKYILEEIEQTQTKLIHSPNAENWKRLANVILCRIVLFNKRRSREASQMTLSQYAYRPSWSEETKNELKSSLSPYEVKLAERHIIVNVIEKRGRIVPVILTPECKTGIDVLIGLRRESFGINKKNIYVFPRCNLTLTYMRGDAILRNITKDIELETRDYIRSIKLRTYVATVCQVLDITENEHDWLARHLGQDVREFYRLKEDTVEVTKVSRLLIAVDMGEAVKFAGKQLKDITLTELPPIKEDDGEEVVEEEAEEMPADIGDEEESDTLDTKLEDIDSEMKIKESIKICIPVRKQLKNCPSKVMNHKIWTTENKQAVFQFFKIQIKNGILPGKKECEACQEMNPSLKSRKWSDIKFCVKNQIAKDLKKKKPSKD